MTKGASSRNSQQIKGVCGRGIGAILSMIIADLRAQVP